MVNDNHHDAFHGLLKSFKGGVSHLSQNSTLYPKQNVLSTKRAWLKTSLQQEFGFY
jgi:hypothetical protein